MPTARTPDPHASATLPRVLGWVQLARLFLLVYLAMQVLRVSLVPHTGAFGQAPVLYYAVLLVVVGLLLPWHRWMTSPRGPRVYFGLAFGLNAALTVMLVWVSGLKAWWILPFTMPLMVLTLAALAPEAHPSRRECWHLTPLQTAFVAGLVGVWGVLWWATWTGPGLRTPEMAWMMRTTFNAVQLQVMVWVLLKAEEHGRPLTQALTQAVVAFMAGAAVYLLLLNGFNEAINAHSTRLPPRPLHLWFWPLLGLCFYVMWRFRQRRWAVPVVVGVAVAWSYVGLWLAPAVSVQWLSLLGVYWALLMPRTHWAVWVGVWALNVAAYGVTPGVPYDDWVLNGLVGTAMGGMVAHLLRRLPDDATGRPGGVSWEVAPTPVKGMPSRVMAGSASLIGLLVAALGYALNPSPSVAYWQALGLVGVFIGFLSYTVLVYWVERQAQQVSLMQMAQIEAVMAHAETAYAVFAADGTPVWANAEACRTGGVTMDEFLRRNLFDRPFWQALGIDTLAPEVLTTGQAVVKQFTGAGLNPHASEQTAEVRIVLGRIVLGGAPHLLVQLQDMAKLNRLTAEVATLKDELQHVVELATVGLVHVRHHRLVWVNPEMALICGRRVEDMVGLSVGDLLADTATAQAVDDAIQAQAKQTHSVFKVTFDIRHQDGSVRHVEASGRMRDVRQGDAIMSVRDMTHERLTQDQLTANLQELTRARDAAQAADLAKGRFMSNISHEMRTPLNSVLGYAHLLAQSGLPHTEAEWVSKLSRSGQLLLTLINDVLDFSKLTQGEFELHEAPLHVERVLQTAADMVATDAQAKGLTVRVMPVPDDVTGAWWGDEQRLLQMVLNLLTNAVKFTHAGHIELSVRGDGDRLCWTVRDTGQGIAPADLPKLFKRFSQVDDSAQRTVQGSGLGLAIVKELAHRMGGDVNVSSELGVGSVFEAWVTLTRLGNDQAVAPVSAEAPRARPAHPLDAVATRPLAGMRVLLVDDNPSNIDVTAQVLDRSGASVHIVTDGQDAVHWLSDPAHEVDAVLMDVHMPVMDGLTATRQLRSVPRLARLPIIGLTAGTTATDQANVWQAGMNAYLIKPIDVTELVGTLRHLVQNGQRF